jgi:hypothetical protein
MNAQEYVLVILDMIFMQLWRKRKTDGMDNNLLLKGVPNER